MLPNYSFIKIVTLVELKTRNLGSKAEKLFYLERLFRNVLFVAGVLVRMLCSHLIHIFLVWVAPTNRFESIMRLRCNKQFCHCYTSECQLSDRIVGHWTLRIGYISSF
jgi:hypothetical protein